VEGRRLILGFKYKLHFNTIVANFKNRSILEQLWNGIFQKELHVDGEVVGVWDEQGSREDATDRVLNEAREVFEG
jgi:hypothetical protein